MRSRKRELEIKLQVPRDFGIDESTFEVDGCRLLELPPVRLSAVYYDTADLRLLRHGFTLRYRSDDSRRGGWCLKMPALDGAGREEIEFGDPSGKLPAEAKALLTAQVRRAEIIPIAKLVTLRRRFSMRNASGLELAELVDDDVTIVEGDAAGTRFREIEIEARSVDSGELESIAGALRENGALESDPTPKIAHAVGPRAGDPPDVPPPPPISGKAPSSQLIRAALALEARRLMAHDPFARLGDIQGVHQMRVASRRLRSHLRSFADMLAADWAEDLSSELRWLGQALGPVRDYDALLGHLRSNSLDIDYSVRPLISCIEVQRKQALEHLISEISSSRYLDLLERIIDAARKPASTDASSERSDICARRIARNAWRGLAGSARLIDRESNPEAFHKVRIYAKRARFAAETAALCLRGSVQHEALVFARNAQQIQNVIGDQRDSAAARRALLEALAQSRDYGTLFLAAALVIQREEHAARESQSQFFKIWKKLDRKRSRNWLKS